MALVPRSTQDKRFSGLIYGAPGVGKTNFGTAYPEEWGEGIYLAVDNDAWRLDSVLKQYRSRLHVYTLDDASPIDNMNQFAVEKWRKVHPKANVLIVDTLSKAAKLMLVHAARTNMFPTPNRIQFGPKTAEIAQGLPVPGDFNGTQYLVRNWINTLFRHQRDMHIIILAHEYSWIPGKDDPASAKAFGGPDTIGSAIVKDVAADFPAVIRLDVDHVTGLDGVSRGKYVAIAAMHGMYTARIKEGDEANNPMAKVLLQRNPVHWYRDYVNHFMKEEVNAPQDSSDLR